MDGQEEKNKDIVYSKSVKAGKRIYYIDLKRNRNNDIYLSLTESKKIISGNPENHEFSFEKHKIFLYREDLSKFTKSFLDVIKYMNENIEQGKTYPEYTEPEKKDEPDSTTDSEVSTKKEATEKDPPINLNIGNFE